jgi:hypothetical protein
VAVRRLMLLDARLYIYRILVCRPVLADSVGGMPDRGDSENSVIRSLFGMVSVRFRSDSPMFSVKVGPPPVPPWSSFCLSSGARL